MDPDGKAAINPVTGAAAGGAIAGPLGAVAGAIVGTAAIYFTADKWLMSSKKLDR